MIAAFGRTGLAVLALLLPLGPLAVAQTTAPPTTPAAPAVAPVQPPAARSSAQVEAHIARLHRDLKITPAQSAQWDAFTKVMRDNAQHMDGLYAQRAAAFGTMNAVDSLKSYEQIEQAHLEDLQKLTPAFSALYESMSDAQKKAADRLFRSNPTN